MGNIFSGQFTYYRPPFRRRRSKRAPSKPRFSINSSSVSAIPISTTVPAVPIEKSIRNHGQQSIEHHRPVSATGSVSSERSQQYSTSIANANSQSSLVKKERKPSIKMALRRVYSNASSTSPNVFSDERRQLVQESWHEISEQVGKLEFIIRIFQTLFRNSPLIRKMFDIPSAEFPIAQSASFVRHAQVFANVLDLAVRNALELETEVGPVLIMFGRRHYNKHRVDFRNEYLTLFAQCISDTVQCSLSENFLTNPEVRAGWRLFISYLIRKVKEGYDLESMQRRK